MKTHFKDVAHLYIGCDIQITEEGESKIEKLEGISMINGDHFMVTHSEEYWFSSNENICEMKPILRPLSDMQQGEIDHLNFLCGNNDWDIDDFIFTKDDVKKWGKDVCFHMDAFAVMLRQGFDLFELIESGQAIDKTKMETI